MSNYDKVIKSAIEYNILSPELYKRAQAIFNNQNKGNKKYSLIN